MVEDTVTIRPYTTADREDVLRIAAATAFFGAPADHFMDDPSLFTDLLYRYYLEVEPERALVAELDGRTVGFIVGSVDTATKHQRWLSDVLPGVAARFARGHYHLGWRTLRYVLASLWTILRYGRSRVDLLRYPAHLHINLLAEARGRGLGTSLLKEFLEELQRSGVPGVHLNTTDHNTAACRLYEKLGFQLLDARPTRAWAPVLKEPVESRCYGIRLDRDDDYDRRAVKETAIRKDTPVDPGFL